MTKKSRERRQPRKEASTRKWRRGWDTQPGPFAILPSFQQHALKPHEYWRSLRSRLFQLVQLFRINSTNFGQKQTPKTPKAGSRSLGRTRATTSLSTERS